MRAWEVSKKGFDHLELVDDYPIPKLESQDYKVLVKNMAVGINPDDYKICDFAPSGRFPFVIGGDGCGTIEQIGPKVDPKIYKPGQLVYYLSKLYEGGAFADYTIQDSRAMSIVPEEAMKDKNLKETATIFASLPVAAFTAYMAVCVKLGFPIFPVPERYNPKVYKNILVTGGSGGLGGFCLQLLRLWQKTLPEDQAKELKIITLCSEKNHDYVKKLGATHAVDYAVEDIASKVLEIAGDELIDAFIDNTGGTTINWGFEVLNIGGDYVSTLPVPKEFDMDRLFYKSQNLYQVYVAYPYLKEIPYKLNELKEIGDIIAKLLVDGLLENTVTQVIKFDEIKDQLIEAAQFHSRGKTVALL